MISLQAVKLSRIVLVLSILTATDALAESQVCAQAVQGRLAWNSAGNVNWSPSNVARLCAGAEDSRAPAECFRVYTSPRLDRGGGGAWTWQEGVELCAGTLSHGATIDCFSERLRARMTRAEAIAACRWDNAATAGGPSPGGPAAVTLPAVVELAAKPLGVSMPASTWSKAEASMSGGTGMVRAAARPPLTPVAGLQRFELQFGDRDHKINRIAVLADDRFAQFALNDSDGQDRFSATATWAVVSAGRAGTARASGGGRMDLALEPGPPDSTLVLTGFEFRRLGGGDANVRSIGVRLAPESRIAHVWLIDDQGFDIRNLESIGWSALGGLVLPPFGHVVAGAATAPAASPGNLRPYEVTIQYAWIPGSVVAAVGSASGTGHRNTDGWIPEGSVMLQGFEFAFGNSDHHLHGIGVTLGDRLRHVMFRDQGTDDPMQWAVSYAVLDSTRAR